jgi:hypothetical protein
MVDALFFTVAAVTLLAAGFKARGLRNPQPPAALAPLCVLLITSGLACICLAPAIQRWENILFPNLGRLVGNITTQIGAFAVLAMMITLSHPPAIAAPMVRRRFAIITLAIAAMAALFLATPLPPVIGDFGAYYTAHPTLVIYNLIFIVGLGTALGEMLVVSWRFAGHAGRRKYLRCGLRTIAAGALIGLIYLAEKALFVATSATGLPQLVPGHDRECVSLITPLGCAFAVLLPALAALIIAVGATIPAWGPILDTPGQWWSQLRTYRRLRPLWAALHQAMPQLELPLPHGIKAYFPHELAFQLYRRVIEIRDGCLLLRPYRDPEVALAANTTARQAGLDGTELDATVEAIELATALVAHTAGVRGQHGSYPLPSQEGVITQPVDVHSEATYLALVADAFANSPLVREHVYRACTSHPGPGAGMRPTTK